MAKNKFEEDDDLPYGSEDQLEHLSKWQDKFRPMSTVKSKPPTWIIPNLLVPGMTLLAGPPKTFKSFLVLNMIASILEGHAIGDPKQGRKAVRRGPVVYFPAEQSDRSLKHIYETRVLLQKMNKRSVDWDFIIPKDVWLWQIDTPEHGYNMLEFIKEWKPLLTVIDPYVHFHSLDENDPRMARPLVPLRHAVHSYGGALVVVHHTKKEQGNVPGGGGNPWEKVRGSSALWAMADGGIMLTRMKGGIIQVQTEFKDHPGGQWPWKPM